VGFILKVVFFKFIYTFLMMGMWGNFLGFFDLIENLLKSAKFKDSRILC
jgi:hypothetical protein